MFGDGPLTFQEFAMREPHPLAVIHDAVLEFLRGRDDAVLQGAQAVNAYVSESRMTEDVDIASPRAADLAEEVRTLLHGRFGIDVHVLKMRKGVGYRIDQTKQQGSRHLVDVRPISFLPPCKRVRKVLVVTPPELIANKLTCMVGRRRTLTAFQDQADLYRLLLQFPKLKREEGPVADRLSAAGAGDDVTAAWKELVAQDIRAEEEDEKFLWASTRKRGEP
jgi:Nucleotidyl transferase AbiEii toxin, Type IV TA system